VTDQIPGKHLGEKLFPFKRPLLRQSIFPPFGSLRPNLPLRTHDARSLSAKHIVSEPLPLAGESFSFSLLSD
jgi:hypothetical protein